MPKNNGVQSAYGKLDVAKDAKLEGVKDESSAKFSEFRHPKSDRGDKVPHVDIIDSSVPNPSNNADVALSKLVSKNSKK